MPRRRALHQQRLGAEKITSLLPGLLLQLHVPYLLFAVAGPGCLPRQHVVHDDAKAVHVRRRAQPLVAHQLQQHHSSSGVKAVSAMFIQQADMLQLRSVNIDPSTDEAASTYLRHLRSANIDPSTDETASTYLRHLRSANIW
jgi:hypothetical protein